MFVLRAKVALTPLSLGRSRACLAPMRRAWSPRSPVPGRWTWRRWHSIAAGRSRNPAAARRTLPGRRERPASRRRSERCPTADASLWNWCGIRAGVPVITAATSDKLVAQSANWELGRRRRFPQRLLSRPGDHRADAVPRASEGAAARVSRDGRRRRRRPVARERRDLARPPAPWSTSADAPRWRHRPAWRSCTTTRSRASTAAGVPLASRALPYAVPALENVRVKL